ncbi:hypothetical protein [Microbacterium binotii]|uniref:Uncharacterized protein n=1 Tax=Microbacterium binotii TaxID=462710 RepID=A0ABN3P6M1_9MICO
MKRRAFVLVVTGWLFALAVPALIFSVLLGLGSALFWPIAALGAGALTLTAGGSRYGGARWAVLVPGLLGSALAFTAAVTSAQGLWAAAYYGALALWLIALVAALVTKGGDAE